MRYDWHFCTDSVLVNLSIKTFDVHWCQWHVGYKIHKTLDNCQFLFERSSQRLGNMSLKSNDMIMPDCDVTVWRWICVQKRSLFYQEDQLISRIWETIWDQEWNIKERKQCTVWRICDHPEWDDIYNLKMLKSIIIFLTVCSVLIVDSRNSFYHANCDWVSLKWISHCYFRRNSVRDSIVPPTSAFCSRGVEGATLVTGPRFLPMDTPVTGPISLLGSTPVSGLMSLLGGGCPSQDRGTPFPLARTGYPLEQYRGTLPG